MDVVIRLIKAASSDNAAVPDSPPWESCHRQQKPSFAPAEWKEACSFPPPCSRPESGSAMSHRDPTLSLCSGSEAIKKERSNLLANHRALTSSSISRFQSLLNKGTCTILSPNYSRSLLIYVWSQWTPGFPYWSIGRGPHLLLYWNQWCSLSSPQSDTWWSPRHLSSVPKHIKVLKVSGPWISREHRMTNGLVIAVWPLKETANRKQDHLYWWRKTVILNLHEVCLPLSPIGLPPVGVGVGFRLLVPGKLGRTSPSSSPVPLP